MDKQEIMQRFIVDFWLYYLDLETRLLGLSNYVELSKKNHGTFSREFQALLQTIGSEVDVCGKSIVEYYQTISCTQTKMHDNAGISNWGFWVERFFPEIVTTSVIVSPGSLYQPWKNWKHEQTNSTKGKPYKLKKGSKNPEWWHAYNATKHRRKCLISPKEDSFERANLKNVINALGGLFVMETLFLKKEGWQSEAEKAGKSKLFQLYSDRN